MVGDILRKAREKQGLTIADIEEGTSIRKLYIEHIEQGNIDALPGMVYAKGFVRNYAAFLHLDAEHLVQQFAEENGAPPAPVPAEPETKPRRISLSSVGDESLSQISIGGRRSSYAGIFGKLALGIACGRRCSSHFCYQFSGKGDRCACADTNGETCADVCCC